ncbi:Apm2p Ecym_4591 [Eremothecium cymbalariae DBVPG|uniref:MHD domain-containing protein n=1 Tax=Eremothecium cymbalariae (strain CBS 270.75 / DBVPG 7215 / KCTC 17166 / NRRL Y-17582) TaxID=931890 RepID=G8JSA1_ERECY|nr:hypothetical protein Ecym_4591 [Eremothecium cymbalariae DBVPG\
MISCLFILDEELQLLTVRLLKPVPSLLEPLEWFIRHPKKSPILQNMDYDYIFIQRDGLYFLSLSYQLTNVYPMVVFSYLNQLHMLFQKYLGENLNKVLITGNFHLIHELIDESIFMGTPQLTDYNIIRDYIKVQVVKDSPEPATREATVTNTKKNKKKDSKKKEEDTEATDENYMNSYIARTTTSAISWRPKGIHYNKNEFYLDVIEHLEYLVDFQCMNIKSNTVYGYIQCRSYLSGMPMLTIGLNKLNSENEYFMRRANFHQCVNLDQLTTDKLISFTPPDGEFQLCNYKLTRNMSDPPMIKLEDCKVKLKPRKTKDGLDRLILAVTISTYFKLQDSTSLLNIKVPLSKVFRDWDVDLSYQPRFKCEQGKVMFNITDDYLLWEVGKVKGGHGDKTLKMQSEFHLHNREHEARIKQQLSNSMDPKPIRRGPHLEKLYQQTHELNSPTSEAALLKVEFEIPYYTISGLKVEFLKIEEKQLQFQSFPWVRYKTINHDIYAYQL